MATYLFTTIARHIRKTPVGLLSGRRGSLVQPVGIVSAKYDDDDDNGGDGRVKGLQNTMTILRSTSLYYN